MSMGPAPWYWARKSVDDGWGQRGWDSDNIQALMRWAMRMASLNVLGVGTLVPSVVSWCGVSIVRKNEVPHASPEIMKIIKNISSLS